LSSSEEESDRGVTLMTLHMAKGLEYERVYIVGLEDGLLPHRQSLDSPDGIEEERRLLYVGMTRAKAKLSLASAHRRRLYSQWVANQPSRFLKEIPLQFFAKSPERSVREPVAQLSYEFDEVRSAHIAVGESVAHPTFGHGVIEAIDEEFGSRKVIVNFDEFGRRKVSANHLECP
jgi:DNA helicase-2/ATP-dependent DNA helicase PcrA